MKIFQLHRMCTIILHKSNAGKLSPSIYNIINSHFYCSPVWPLGLKFLSSPAPQVIEARVFINDTDDKTEECFAVRIVHQLQQ